LGPNLAPSEIMMVSGSKNVELSTVLKDEARFFTFTVTEGDAVAVKELKLPADARVVFYYREDKFAHADEETTLRTGDEVVILTHSKNLDELGKRWQPKQRAEESKGLASTTNSNQK
jgi:trk/ktr system potassium uptake protein